jgi:hypothetical protein
VVGGREGAVPRRQRARGRGARRLTSG